LLFWGETAGKRPTKGKHEHFDAEINSKGDYKSINTP